MPYSMIPYRSSTMERETTSQDRSENIISVNGVGSVKAKPDIAIINVGVITEDKDIRKSQEENASKINNIIKALNTMGIKNKDIQTIDYSITKTYNYVDGKQIFRGYQVRHILQVTVRDMGNVGQVYDVAVDNGANSEGGINFAVSNINKYYNDALDLAVKDAKEKATTISTSFGTKIKKIPIRVKEISTAQQSSKQSPNFFTTTAATPETSIQEGSLDIIAQLNIVFEIV